MVFMVQTLPFYCGFPSREKMPGKSMAAMLTSNKLTWLTVLLPEYCSFYSVFMMKTGIPNNSDVRMKSCMCK